MIYLQFQDRVSQILSHVIDAMKKLSGVVDEQQKN